MKQTRFLMGMPITIAIVDKNVKKENINKIFDYFLYIDKKFSTYKKQSEISRINEEEVQKIHYSSDMKKIFSLAEQTKNETGGYFDIYHNGKYDPSGIVKGWAIQNASILLKKQKFTNFYIEAGGDIQVSGQNHKREKWRVGIRNPFNFKENIKALFISNEGVATSGVYTRGQHIYNPHKKNQKIKNIVSISVVGTNIYEADRFATAAFAMGDKGIHFIESLKGFEGYMIDKNGLATYTTGFNKYTNNND